MSEGPGYTQCSAKDCRREAAWVLVWNNPKIHDPQRRKTWSACDEHRAHLGDFLAKRDFLREVVHVDDFSG